MMIKHTRNLILIYNWQSIHTCERMYCDKSLRGSAAICRIFYTQYDTYLIHQKMASKKLFPQDLVPRKTDSSRSEIHNF